jgi:CheY-like chemotaxis protein
MPQANDVTKVVLIVDPDGVESGALGRSLRQLGCEAQSCLDMHAALIAARAERPALVVSSAELLDGDGFNLCDQLRAEPTLAGVPIVLLCAPSVASIVKAHARSAKRADAYLMRPLSIASIVERVATFLGEDDDDELSLNTAQVVAPPSTPRPPPPKRRSAPSSLPPSSRVPRPSEASASKAPPSRPSIRAPLPLPSLPPQRGPSVPPRESLEVKRLQDELRALEAKHAAALAKQRDELETAFRAEKAALEKMNELQLRDVMRQRDKARADLAKLADVEQSIARARDSLIEAMRGVDLAAKRLVANGD